MAADGDTVVLGAGTFAGTGNIDVDFLGKAVRLTSESGPGTTIIDCQSAGRAFLFLSGEGSGSVLANVTIRNGFSTVRGGAIECVSSSPGIHGNVFFANRTSGDGGAIFVKNGAPTILNNTFVENEAARGSGLFLDASGSPLVSYNIFAYGLQGGAVHCKNASSSPQFECNDFFSNLGGDAICGIDLGNNQSQDPLFCGIGGSGNVYLQSNSPCLSGSSPCGVRVGALGTLCGTTAIERATWGGIKTRYRSSGGF